MNKKRLFIIVFALLLNMIMVFFAEPANVKYNLRLTLSASQEEMIQIYLSDDKSYSENSSGKVKYDKVGNEQELVYEMNRIPAYLRIDFGEIPAELTVSKVELCYSDQSKEIVLSENEIESKQMITTLNQDGDDLSLVTNGNDSYVVWKLDTERLNQSFTDAIAKENQKMKVIYLVIIDLVLLLVVIFCNTLTDIPLEIIRSKRLVMDLAHNDFKTRFAGSYFGILWAFVQPIVIICLYWFVFQFGFKSGSVGDYPYVLWLVAGLVPWFFFSEALTSATNALLDYRYLVKKVVFQISILPTVKIISNCFVHIFFIGFAVVIYAIMGFFPTIYLIQIVYYFLCTVAFLMALTYATSAMVLFFRDLGQIINIFMQVFMWATPIMWNEAILPGSIVWIFKLNPLYYVTMGYRDALMNHVWFFQRVGLTVYFWTVVICLFFLGTTIFKRLRPHFADVL